MVIYIDDTLLINREPEKLRQQGALAMLVFENAGFVVNREKSIFTPCKRIKFLGFNIDSEKFTIELTANKTANALNLMQGLLHKKNKLIPIKIVARVIGTLVSVFPACPDGQLRYRELERAKIKALKETGSWKGKMKLPVEGVKELNWWAHMLQNTPVRSIHKTAFNCHFYLDAAKSGWGTLVAGDTVNGAFSSKQQLLSINTRELLAVYFGLLSLREKLRNKAILCHCNNTMAVSCILKHRSPDKIRNRITINIFELIDDLNSSISAVHLSRSENGSADSLSRKIMPTSTLNGPCQMTLLLSYKQTCHLRLISIFLQVT